MMRERRISSRSFVGWGLALAGLLLGGLLAAGCGGRTNDVTAFGGESHFLRSCAEGCGDGLECLSGVCTRGCDALGAACADLVAAAECVAAGDGAPLRCDLLCSVDDDCAPLAALSAASAPAHRCLSGSCREPAAAGPDASDDGIVPSGLALVAGRCESDVDCGGATGACGELPSGYRVCLDQTPPATEPSINPTADQCDETRACPSGSTCYFGLTYPSGACGLGGASQQNVCREDGCASDADCAAGFFCGPAGLSSDDSSSGGEVRRCFEAGCSSHADCNLRPGGSCALLYAHCQRADVGDPLPGNLQPARVACVYPNGCTADFFCSDNAACRVVGGASVCVRPR